MGNHDTETLDRRLRSYLLGNLPEAEAEALEEYYFADDACFERLLLAEDDLVEGYVTEGLKWHERRQFEVFYLATPGKHQLVEVTRDIIAEAALRRRRSWAYQWQERLKGLGTSWAALRKPLVSASCAAAILVAMLSGFWLGSGWRPVLLSPINIIMPPAPQSVPPPVSDGLPALPGKRNALIKYTGSSRPALPLPPRKRRDANAASRRAGMPAQRHRIYQVVSRPVSLPFAHYPAQETTWATLVNEANPVTLQASAVVQRVGLGHLQVVIQEVKKENLPGREKELRKLRKLSLRQEKVSVLDETQES